LLKALPAKLYHSEILIGGINNGGGDEAVTFILTLL